MSFANLNPAITININKKNFVIPSASVELLNNSPILLQACAKNPTVKYMAATLINISKNVFFNVFKYFVKTLALVPSFIMETIAIGANICNVISLKARTPTAMAIPTIVYIKYAPTAVLKSGKR